MDLPRLRALNDYWAQVPPLHISVASALGTIKQAPKKLEQGDIEQLMQMFPQAGSDPSSKE